jgi:VWFA-related protein
LRVRALSLRVPALALRVPALALGVLALALGVRASVSAQQAVFRTSTQYVRVDVVVTDKDDKPIEGLTKDDFEIIDDGRPQRVDTFQFVKIPVAKRTLARSASVEPVPDVVSNQPATADSRLFAVVIDDMHLLEKDVIPIKALLMEFLQSLSPNDEVAFTFVNRSDYGVNFTRDTTKLVNAVERMRGALGFGLDASGTDSTGNAARYLKDVAWSSFLTLQSVVRSAAGSSHPRRAVLFVSNGELVDVFGQAGPPVLEFFDAYESLFRDAAKADVPIYTYSPRGAFLPQDAVRGDGIRSVSARANVIRNMRIMNNNLIVIANSTGGRAIVDAADMPRMIDEIVAENGAFYLLGYYPDPFAADGKRHEIAVKVKREGARVRGRTGYDAPPKPGSKAASLDDVTRALNAGVNLAGIPLRAFVAPVALDGKRQSVAITVQVDYPAPADGADRIDDEFDVRLAAIDPDGKLKQEASRTIKVGGRVRPGEGATFLINERMDLPAQALTVRVAVASHGLGRAGSIQVPVESLRGGEIAMSGLVVGLDGAPREAVLPSAALDSLVPFQPVTDRVFASSDTLRLFGRVYWKDKKMQPALSLTIDGGPASHPAMSADGAVITQLPLTNLTAGPHRLTIEASLPNGKRASRDVMFEVR